VRSIHVKHLDHQEVNVLAELLAASAEGRLKLDHVDLTGLVLIHSSEPLAQQEHLVRVGIAILKKLHANMSIFS
jgi:predicted Ser/Thr protein kinase